MRLENNTSLASLLQREDEFLTSQYNEFEKQQTLIDIAVLEKNLKEMP